MTPVPSRYISSLTCVEKSLSSVTVSTILGSFLRIYPLNTLTYAAVCGFCPVLRCGLYACEDTLIPCEASGLAFVRSAKLALLRPCRPSAKADYHSSM